jgi:hypothetical protein
MAKKTSKVKTKKVVAKVKQQKLFELRPTKHQKVKEHLINKGIISSWEAIKLYKATRLSAIIFNLRKDGMDIVSLPKSSKDENGHICNYVDYKYVTKK